MIAVPTAAQNIPFVGVRGKYGKINELNTPHFYADKFVVCFIILF